MSKQEYDSHLRFGQGILIEGFKTDGLDQGFLTAQGFADIKAKYETYDDLLFFKNYRNSIFQILPAGNFELNDELQKALIENEGEPDTSNIRILKARAESERVQFELNIENNMKKKVCFGQNVIFKHIDSGSYISGTIKPSTGSNGAFTVQVSEKLSESLVFKLMPYRSFEFIDMAIPFDSPILIRNEFNYGYLTFEKIGMGDQGKSRGTYIEKKPIESNDSYRIPVKTQSLKSDVYEVVTHFVDLSCEREVPMPWRFKLHVNDVVNDTLIQHDVVYLKHTENGGVLSTQGQNIILKELKNKTTDELSFYECLWEIERHQDAGDDSYILRHLMSGMVLGQEQGADAMRHAVLKDISEGKAEGAEIGYVQVKLAKKEGGEINSESFVNIAWGEELLETHDEESALQESATKLHDPEAKIDLARMRSLYKREIEYNIRPLAFKKSVTQEHCFVIMEIEDDLKRELLFAMSFHSVIIRLREDLQWGAIEAAKKINYLRMMQVTNKIKEIKNFIKNCSEEEAELEHIFPVYKRQMICKDLGISELLFELLYFMKMNLREDIFSDKHNEREKFLELYNTLYEVINELVRKNALFKMHVSKWFEFVLDDVIANNEPCQLSLLKELLRDNLFFVNNFVSQPVVAYLTTHYTAAPHLPAYHEKKYLEIFRLFCIVANTVNTHNQKLILDHFINVLKHSHSIYEIQLLQEDGKILVCASLDKTSAQRFEFREFYERCAEENPSAWLYFVEYLNLIADLAQGRNKITEMELSQTYTQELLGDLFEREELHEAEVPVIRLLHYLYAESENFYPIEKKRKILNYNTLARTEDEISIHSTLSAVKPWDSALARVLDKLLEKLRAYRDSPISPVGEDNFQKNQILLTLLKFLWETINLGFWHSKECVKEILTDLLNLLRRSEEITDYAAVMIESKENLLMIECKLECLNIIDLIAEYDGDVFVQFIASRFRDFEFPEKKFSLKGMFNSSPMLEIKCDHEMVGRFLASLPADDTIQPILETSIIDAMIELSNYNNASLTSKAISIIDRVLQTRQKAFQQFAGLIIISEEERLKLLDFMELHRNKFFLLEDSNIVNVTDDNQVCNYFMIYDRASLGLMEVLYLLTELMKNENSVLALDSIRSIHQAGIFEALGSNRLINFTGERSSTSRMKQEIVYSSNLHLKVLNFIFACESIPESELAVKLLHLCYYFIVSLIENFNQIKSLMQWHIPRMIHHIKRNVGCIDFLKEMYDNNKTMLYNESAVFQLITEICENIEHEPDHSFYKSKLLDFFRYLIYCNGRALKSHQIQILKIMQDDSYSNIMVHVTEAELAELIAEYEEQNRESEEIVMSPRLTYICTFFQMLAALIDTNNKVNIGKLIKRYPFDTLVDFLGRSGACWPLKRNLRSFINRLYYFQPEIDAQLKPIFSREMHNFIHDLDLYILGKSSPDAHLLENKRFKNPVRFSYLESYHYLLVEETVFAVFNLATRQTVAAEIAKYLNNSASRSDLQPTYNWFRIVERLAWLQQFFTTNKNVYSNSLIKYVLSKIKPLLLLVEDRAAFAQSGSLLSADESQFRLTREAVINRLLTGNIGKFYEERAEAVHEGVPLCFLMGSAEKEKVVKVRDEGRLKEVLRTIFRREKRDFQNEDERISYNLQQLISSIKLSPATQKYTLSEFLEKVETYYLRDDRFEYIARIIELNSKHPTALTSERKIFFLQFITGLVEASNKAEEEEPIEAVPEGREGGEAGEGGEGEGEAALEFKKDIDEWEAEDWSGNKERIEETQKSLKKCELGRFIVELLKEDIVNNIELANSILLCAISYLLGGNTLTQKNIIEELEKDAENKVFENIEGLIGQLGSLIKKNIVEATTGDEEGSGEFSPNTVDNYDYYDVGQRYTLRKNVFEPNSTDEYLYNKLCITTYRRAFKFLQLLCENNNKEGKNFIRVQPGKAKQYNFIDITTKELRNLFHIFCSDIQEVPLFLLDFILEVTQIPIYENQQALISSTFFEDLCQLKNSFASEQTIVDRGFKSLEHVEAIYYKSFKIILSNFEGNDRKTFEAVDSKLEPKFLIDIMKDKLRAMNISTQDELVTHIRNYSNQINEEGGKNTGFDDDVLILLDIATIFLKIKDSLNEKSRIFGFYEKSKKEEEDLAREATANRLRDDGVAEKDLEEAVNEAMKEYKCLNSYLERLLLNIEITDDKGKDQFIYFPKYPVFSSLTGNLRDYIMGQVSRSSHREKIVSLLSFTDGVKQKIEYSYNLEKMKKITEKNMKDSFNVAATLSVIICAYIIYFYNIIIEYQEAEFYSDLTIGFVRLALSFFQLTFSVLFVFYWLELKLWLNPEPINRGEEAAPEEEAPAEVAAEEAVEEVAPTKLQAALQKVKEVGKRGYAYYQVVMEELNTEDQRIYKNLQLWRIVLFLVSSIVGTFYFPPMFFLHLIDILAQVPTLGPILYCVIVNSKSLLLVSLMGIFFSFIFCTVTFSNYMKDLYTAADELEDMCDNVMRCVIQLYISGAIGETMESFEILRYLYDIIYFIFFEMLFGNIVSGLMLDAFSSLREDADALETDKKNKCYICDISRESLEKQGFDFDEHTRNKHFLWNYIFYIYVLERKDETDYTGLEYYIKQQYFRADEEMEVKWIPNKGESEFDVEAEAQALTDELKVKLEETGSRYSTLEESINEFKLIAKSYIE